MADQEDKGDPGLILRKYTIRTLKPARQYCVPHIERSTSCDDDDHLDPSVAAIRYTRIAQRSRLRIKSLVLLPTCSTPHNCRHDTVQVSMFAAIKQRAANSTCQL
ncbi:hypothetical protein MTO96_040122 [Rhipicephalus appendiculatus]